MIRGLFGILVTCNLNSLSHRGPGGIHTSSGEFRRFGKNTDSVESGGISGHEPLKTLRIHPDVERTNEL